MSQKIIYAGGPCTCRPGRYVRYFIPDVPGCEATVYCRAVDAGKEGKAQHPPPAGAVFALRAPRGAVDARITDQVWGWESHEGES